MNGNALVDEILGIQDEIEELRRQRLEISVKIAIKHEESDAIMQMLYPEVSYPVITGERPCENALGTCVYDDYTDVVHDQCVVCGNPEERK